MNFEEFLEEFRTVILFRGIGVSVQREKLVSPLIGVQIGPISIGKNLRALDAIFLAMRIDNLKFCNFKCFYRRTNTQFVQLIFRKFQRILRNRILNFYNVQCVSRIFRRMFRYYPNFDYLGCEIECADINFDEDRWQPFFRLVCS